MRKVLLLIFLGTFVLAADYRLPRAERYEYALSPTQQIIGSYYPATTANASLIIFFHMLGRNRGDWNECARFMQKDGFAVISVDMPGHGESRKAEDKDILTTITAVVVDIQKKTNSSVQKTVVVGMGYGATLAAYVHHVGLVAGSVLIEPIAEVHGLSIYDYVGTSTKPLYVIVTTDSVVAQRIKSLTQSCAVDIYTQTLNPLRFFMGNTVYYEHISRWAQKILGE